MAKRTPLAKRTLPAYTRGEEIFNMVSHIVGGAFGIVALVLCVLVGALHGTAASVVGGAVFGTTMILLYTMSSVYHGLRSEMVKKVFQVIDHCTIYLLIAGTYTPITLCALRSVDHVVGWLVFGFIWGMAAIGIIFNAIDLKRYRVFSMICYLGMGWCIIFAIRPTIQALQAKGLALLFLGGFFYTVGAILYGLGRKYKYMHSIFHLFVLAGSIFHFFLILLVVLPM